MPSTVAALTAESADLDALVRDLPEPEWARPTPAAGWSIAHQIAHLAWTDEVALVAATDPDGFAAQIEAALADPEHHVDRMAEEGVSAGPAALLARWREARSALAAALDGAPADTRIPWFGPPMSPRSMATARLMETWAHGQDVADALGVERTPTDRLRDVAHLGVRTRDYAYGLHGRTPPTAPFAVELDSPGGGTWTWHDDTDEVAGTVRGSALDFCLVVTQRRPVQETGLRATGEAAAWLTFAQAFAGAPKGAR
ncbi:TIGR03084 family metal-binding protein [Janibacter alkaliphilus]|uniref:Uncharacterized protein (TIGR03084 family) n=1 Tax=Janibacter alkaliphilus TaxID=1069963 RepID=A0A852XBI5_9MICO|nr:TIGR03084 family metal-binding protein [Janibacter alkaliphilus]NYG37774.1 uncharacterized protein (TIGR03084 family) [Janibacter alkaliphilus]